MIDIGIFLLAPTPGQALGDALLAEELGFESVWIAEHHGTGIGTVGAPSVLAAATAAKTQRIRIGYAVAVVPLHHPLRLAEEIAWVDHLSGGRVLAGLGSGFSADEFAAMGVPLDERHARLEEGTAIIRGALMHEDFEHHGRFWTIPRITITRPRTKPHPPLLRACATAESAQRAQAQGMPVMFSFKPNSFLATSGVREVTVLRRVSIAETDAEARASLQADELDSALCGTPDTVARQLEELETLGVRRVIGLFRFGTANARRSMELMASVIEARIPVP